MNQTEIYQFVERYLTAQECQIIMKDPAYLTTRLSIKADKDITNRPYYWMFVEKTGAEPLPLQLTFIFDQEKAGDEVQGELIKFGCWRFHQIFHSAKKHGQLIRLYEEVSSSSSAQALVPWLLLNYRISFISDQKMDIFYPLGFNLISGHILTEFDQTLNQFRVTPKIPDYHFTLRPIFSLQSAISQIEQHIHQYLETQDKKWAKEANDRLDEETKLLKSFFEHQNEEQQQTLLRRLEEVNHYRPKIEIHPINIGIIYLQTNPLSNIR